MKKKARRVAAPGRKGEKTFRDFSGALSNLFCRFPCTGRMKTQHAERVFPTVGEAASFLKNLFGDAGGGRWNRRRFNTR